MITNPSVTRHVVLAGRRLWSWGSAGFMCASCGDVNGKDARSVCGNPCKSSFSNLHSALAVLADREVVKSRGVPHHPLTCLFLRYKTVSGSRHSRNERPVVLLSNCGYGYFFFDSARREAHECRLHCSPITKTPEL